MPRLFRRRPDSNPRGTPELPHEVFVRAVYRGCLERDPDPQGFADYVERLRSGALSWEDLVAGVVRSAEFEALRATRAFMQSPLVHLHDCRKTVFAQYLPAANVVLDLGGAANENPEGALFALGYPHAPRELIIVDLPPAERAERPAATGVGEVIASRGTHIRYEYGSMTDLHFVADDCVDLVVSGQSIEHVTETEADQVCRESYRVLRRGGHLCLDTPNARLTRLQSPDRLIHPEHKKEYSFTELKEKLEAHGFEIANALAVCAMPRSAEAGRFDYGEMIAAEHVAADPEVGYAVFIDAVKPLAESAQ